MKISFDIDGVLANFNENVAPIINDKFGPDTVPSDPQPTDWYYNSYGLKKEDWGPIFDVIKVTPNFWRREPPYQRNVDAAIRFINNNPDVTVYFMTQRPDTEGGTAYDQTLDWLVTNGLYPFDKEVTTPIIVKDPTEKKGLIEDLEIDFSIDDKQETVTQCNEIIGHKAYLLNRPWNQSSIEPRVYSVDDFVERVRGKK
jgi:hypothetical protein